MFVLFAVVDGGDDDGVVVVVVVVVFCLFVCFFVLIVIVVVVGPCSCLRGCTPSKPQTLQTYRRKFHPSHAVSQKTR